ncbi:TauD/TfdA family dioxygenase [Streptomyces sp. NPDC002886]|uniref:TauD/TfdA family dioxygenase n=1 Tax=Streptomyces sp. NPDC002886 TaxID=3364667 RepID=UPI0036A72A16
MSSITSHALAAEHCDADVLLDNVRRSLAVRHFALVSGFTAEVGSFIEFISELGKPLTYYGGTEGSHPDHGAIHRVRYDPEGSSRGELHAVDGPLDLHSAQSLRDPRPQYFCMLMVDSGWQDQPFGNNGESVLISWSDAFDLLQARDPEAYERTRATLLSDIPFPDGTARPVAYHLEQTRTENDLGVRLKYDLLDNLRAIDAGSPEAESVASLCDAAREASRCFQLQSRDLVIIDNDRFGHGRMPVSGRRTTMRGEVCHNPRELWSVTLA